MKKSFTLLFWGFTLIAFGQGTQPIGNAKGTLDVTNVNASLLMAGDMFSNLTDSGFEVPRGSGKHTIYTGALWLGGKDTSGQLYLSQQTYRQNGLKGFWAGPVGSTHNPAHNAKYNRFWKVSKAQVEQHILSYNSPGYTMPSDIASWPGNGNAANGEAAQLAPYTDVNNDGIYNPALGDYPLIKGDQALYQILNDKGNVKVPASPAMSAEIHMMHYGFNAPGNTAVNNTIFTDFRIVNRGLINLQDVYAGLWMDFDLGNPLDDFVGCDTLMNRYYAYNGDADDEGSWGYGLTAPCQSVMFLNQPMGHFVYYENSLNPVNGNPDSADDYYNYLKGFWRNSVQVTYGADGTVQNNPNNPPVRFMFPGNPATQLGWSERNRLDSPVPVSNAPGDRRGVGSIAPFNLLPGQELSFSVANTFSQSNTYLNSVTQSQLDAQTVKNFYTSVIMASPEELVSDKSLKLYPNPASHEITIQLPAAFRNNTTTVSVIDNVGRKVLKIQASTQNAKTINVSSLPKGLYQVVVKSGDRILTSKLVKL